MKPTTGVPILLLCLTLMPVDSAAAAELTSAQKRELSAIRRDVSKVSTLAKRRRFDEARQVLDDAETRLNKIADEANIPLEDRRLATTQNLLVRQRHSLAMREDPKKVRAEQNSVSFVKHVAPILQAHCVECHSDDPGGKLKLDTFAGMKKGGETGPLLVMGNANRSLVMYRLAVPEQHRMPQKTPPLTPAQLSLIALWINQGANFDGSSEEHDLEELLDPKQVAPPREFPKPVGGETVSFKTDIAPFMVKYCLRCHQGKKPSGGLLLVDFESIMLGGRHGKIIIPGNPDESLMHQLMGSYDENNRMPLEGKVTRKNFEDLGTWIREGAKYDGENSRLHLRMLNPAESEMRAAELASLTAEQFDQFREARSKGQWKKVFPDTDPKSVSTPEIVFYGDVATGRLTEVQEWAAEHLATLRELFEPGKDQPLWRGRLAVFILRQRSDFELFNQQVASRRIFSEEHGTYTVAPTFEDAFIVLYETGDESDGTAPTLKFSLIDQLTGAYLATVETSYPDWITQGLGPALATPEVDRDDMYVAGFREAAVESLSELEKPADVFRDGVFFSAEQARPVSVTLTCFLLKRGRVTNLAKLMAALRNGGDIDNSIRTIYFAEPDSIARLYLSSLNVKRK